MRASGLVPAAAVAAAEEALAAPVATELEIELTVHAPPGTDAAALVADLREHLPAGITLEEHDGKGAGLLAAAH